MPLPSLPKRITEYAEARPEGAPIFPRELLHLGNRAAIARALSRLLLAESLMRICRGVYVRTLPTSFGFMRSPDTWKTVKALADRRGEIVVLHSASLANGYRFTSQVQLDECYWTSGPDRELRFGKRPVFLLRAPRWRLVAPGTLAGDAVRILDGLGSVGFEEKVDRVVSWLPPADRAALGGLCAVLPARMAGPIGARLARERPAPAA